MCMNRKFDENQQAEIKVMTEYAKLILQGITPADIALDEGTTEEHVHEVSEKIKDINPYLYEQVKAKLAG